MKKTSETIVFFGSGPVAARSLELLSQKFAIEAVVTKPKPVHHKGSFPVLDLAATKNLPTYTVSSKQELGDLVESKPFQSRLGVLIDFGIIVSQKVIDYFPLGIVNSHFSVLPEWRGADPITFAVLSGQEKTGVSLMLLVEKMDEGPLLAFGEYELPKDITTPVLTEHLINFSDGLLEKTLPGYLSGDISKPAPQTITERAISYSRKLTKEDGKIDWGKSALQIDREVRAFLGWPGSFTELAGKPVIITKAHVTTEAGKSGTVLLKDKGMIVHCGVQSLAIDTLKPAGKKEMSGYAFVAGHRDKLV